MATITEREKRVGLHLPLQVSGDDAAGAAFAESSRSVNVSGGGLCFETGRILIVGARLVVRIALPPALRRHFRGKAVYRARAVVCRVEPSLSDAVSRVGVRFLGEV
jgi:PilZ domain